MGLVFVRFVWLQCVALRAGAGARASRCSGVQGLCCLRCLCVLCICAIFNIYISFYSKIATHILTQNLAVTTITGITMAEMAGSRLYNCWLYNHKCCHVCASICSIHDTNLYYCSPLTRPAPAPPPLSCS